MKKVNTIMKAAFTVLFGAGLIAGCSTPTIPVTMKVAGEIKLTGVSKIALVDFNSLPGDSFSGIAAADKDTCALVKRTVAASFYKTKTYQIADLDLEQAIHGEQKTLPAKRYDAIVCGRVWWQISPETDGRYPYKFTLEKWENVPYVAKVLGKDVPLVAHVTSERQDVLKMLDYRTRSAVLMLALTVYRVDGNGMVSKIVDTYQVTENGFTLMNGKMKVDCADIGTKADGVVARLQKTGAGTGPSTAYQEMFAEPKLDLSALVGGTGVAPAASLMGLGGLGGGLTAFGGTAARPATLTKAPANEAVKKDSKVDANGKTLLLQNTVTIPTELQAKLMLASKLSGDLSAKVAPTEVTFDSPWVDRVVFWFWERKFDAKLTNLLNSKAWDGAQDYIVFTIRTKLGKELSAKIDPLTEYVSAEPLAPSTEKFDNDEDFKEYLADEKINVYLYALGLCQEAIGKTETALYTYRYAFDVKPSQESALGISRCLMALGQNARLKETNKAAKSAEKKAKMD